MMCASRNPDAIRQGDSLAGVGVLTRRNPSTLLTQKIRLAPFLCRTLKAFTCTDAPLSGTSWWNCWSSLGSQMIQCQLTNTVAEEQPQTAESEEWWKVVGSQKKHLLVKSPIKYKNTSSVPHYALQTCGSGNNYECYTWYGRKGPISSRNLMICLEWQHGYCANHKIEASLEFDK